jgi:hypothetical protein
MTQDRIHKFWGTPIDEWIERVPNELPRDAVSLWQIVAEARFGYDLEGDSLNDFIRRCLLGLFASGAMPVKFSQDNVHDWALQTEYLGEPDVMADHIISNWIKGGRETPDESDLWFALPQMYETRFNKD